MRVLALDYGSARCGCAVCDPTETIVTPLDTVEKAATRRGLGILARLIGELEVQRVVVGLPISLRGEDTQQTQETRAFAERLRRRVEVPVELFDERDPPQAHASEDSRAAAHLLEGWLAGR
jgi:putative Holliday junction resolvase